MACFQPPLQAPLLRLGPIDDLQAPDLTFHLRTRDCIRLIGRI